jgi:hypothetical protein
MSDLTIEPHPSLHQICKLMTSSIDKLDPLVVPIEKSIDERL